MCFLFHTAARGNLDYITVKFADQGSRWLLCCLQNDSTLKIVRFNWNNYPEKSSLAKISLIWRKLTNTAPEPTDKKYAHWNSLDKLVMFLVVTYYGKAKFSQLNVFLYCKRNCGIVWPNPTLERKTLLMFYNWLLEIVRKMKVSWKLLFKITTRSMGGVRLLLLLLLLFIYLFILARLEQWYGKWPLTKDRSLIVTSETPDALPLNYQWFGGGVKF